MYQNNGPGVQGYGCPGTGARFHGRSGGQAAAGDGGEGRRAYGWFITGVEWAVHCADIVYDMA